MNTENSHGSLFLYLKSDVPKQSDHVADKLGQENIQQADFKPYNHPTKDLASFICKLQKIGLIAEKTDKETKENHFFTGKKYLNYISYMGCAPAIQFKKNEDNAHFCFIKIHQYLTKKLIYSQQQLPAPHCPQCKRSVKNWQHVANLGHSSIRCDLCNTTSSIGEFNWRKMAGFAQLFIEITDIFPKEALPQQILLDKSGGLSNAKWQYFYCY